jgi:hypothetical protein
MARILLATIPTLDTPNTNQVSIYAKTDKKLYYKDDFGNEYQLLYSGSATGAEYRVEYFELDLGNLSAKQIELAETPTQPERTVVDVFNGGGPMRYGIDFTVTGSTLSWSGGRFDGVFEEQDELRVIYY